MIEGAASCLAHGIRIQDSAGYISYAAKQQEKWRIIIVQYKCFPQRRDKEWENWQSNKVEMQNRIYVECRICRICGQMVFQRRDKVVK